MKAIFYICLPLCLLGLSGCVSPTRIDYDSAALPTIRSYKCYEIDSRETRKHYQDVVLSPIVDRRIEAALNAELQSKGFQSNCAEPDFRITFNTTSRKVSEVRDLSLGGSPFRRYPYYGYGGYHSIDVVEYEEGTFLVDIIDQQSQELVWRGAYKKRLGWSAPTDAEVRAIVSEILQNFPPAPASHQE
ncbi:DUF4136 domain-containing protein [Coraliomargarita parva]|uniref:DUF4136 domain-containing protein n=1 Tax=Coraliomargarita parva TaxID=3014050 RepID=UPI0022B30790|nr:DUF4136 domain-containing protein [Coraliomargarita parva]